MKDTLLTARTKKQELKILLFCYLAANLINFAAIIWYDTRWIEIFSQQGYVVCFTLIFYVIVLVLRLIVRGLFCKSRRQC